MEITGTLVLAADATITPVDEFSNELRRQVQAMEGDCVVTRPNSRTLTRIVDGDAARLLEEFRLPTTVVQAVIRYCSVTREDPESTLDAAFPMIERLVHDRLLVPADSPQIHSTRPVLEIGSHFAGAKVLECIQALEDTDVYRAVASHGETVALKLMHPTAGSEVHRMFDREARILKHLDAKVTPALLGFNTENELRYLLLSWCHGSDCASTATRYRSSGDYSDLLRLSLAILDAYSHLHAQNVIHSDVHPQNILVDHDGSVRLVDFGLAHIIDIEDDLRDKQRGGVGYFLEPEYAIRVRGNLRAPNSSMLGEQYSLGALLYLLITGEHYIDFSLERHSMLRQIAEDGPLPFRARGVQAWPAVEDILAKALAKNPAARFASVATFAKALGSVGQAPSPASSADCRVVRHAVSREILMRTLKRLDVGAPLLQSGLADAPRTSVTYGSAGVACALHRIACARQDPKILSLADLWGERAAREVGLRDAEAWYCPDMEITADTVGRVSPYHTESGFHLVKALIAHSMGDVITQQRAADEFVATSLTPCDSLDLALGRSGTLLAASHLLGVLGLNSAVNVAALRDLGNATMASIWQQLDSYAAISECPQIRYSGIAHGWAGILYATLCWSHASGVGLPASTEERLNQLAGLAHHSGRQAIWSWVASDSHDAPGAMGGWCHGSAGQVHLWLAAHSALGDDRYLVLANGAAMHAAETDTSHGNLCCGFSGQAYALLAFYRQSGERAWLHRAQALAEKAAIAYRERPSEDYPYADALRADSLYKGELGVAVLAADLEDPYAAIQPAFEYLAFTAP
jgi:eukaryotic-like serine/threonine-protein kinase